jgi:hypothetical protein
MIRSWLISENFATNIAQNTYEESDFSDWTVLPSKRLLVVQFVSSEKISEFNQYWESHEKKFMLSLQNAPLLLSCPSIDASLIIKEIVEFHDWQLTGEFKHNHPFAHGALFRFKTPAYVEVFFQPLVVTLPRYHMNKPVIPTCRNRTWSLSYAMYSGAVFSYHLIHLPLVKKYDYFLKVDTDIEFLQEMPFDIGEDLSTRGCLIGHSAITGSNDCEDNNLSALLAATRALGLNPPKSLGYSWCNENNAERKGSVVLYGNFAAFSTKLILHDDILQISEYMYEEYEKGYFVYRWGDQGPFIMYACHMLDLPDLRNNAQVCDYSKLRNSVFSHN